MSEKALAFERKQGKKEETKRTRTREMKGARETRHVLSRSGKKESMKKVA